VTVSIEKKEKKRGRREKWGEEIRNVTVSNRTTNDWVSIMVSETGHVRKRGGEGSQNSRGWILWDKIFLQFILSFIFVLFFILRWGGKREWNDSKYNILVVECICFDFRRFPTFCCIFYFLCFMFYFLFFI
jgi:hypothetical protein